ncbi:Gfo/Idh/MocA family oxidoreductase [Persicobacter psychrovividus]|uniref:Dehydrogenase n=1 Tax=Persicobacter psychrovividus TaxID=387638 RepID=A0ABM7VLZ2_9BACT|nr:dehydrogenase [Persicobacter psychrovividus]
MESRRNFLKKTSLATAATLLAGHRAFAEGEKKIRFAMLGCGGRSHALIKAAYQSGVAEISHLCDVDKRRLKKLSEYTKQFTDQLPKTEEDFRNLLTDPSVDAVFIATPEHWHAPMAIMAMRAGKHVYIEKPCSHNPHETEVLIATQKETGMMCQMGNQQRSSVTSALAIKEIKAGIIGDPYAAKAWYANTRKPIGIGKEVAVPEYLNWELWQGPAPRQAYRDNVHPYNWHWFRDWGTGEIHNNGTHEIDVCRWALGVDYPTQVTSNGGRLSHSGDDWQWFDTQTASYQFEGGKMITWEGHSCNGFSVNGGRGAMIFGTKGSILLDREKYVLFDLKGKEIKRELESNKGTSNNTADTTGFDGLTVSHIANLCEAIRNGQQLTAPIDDAGISTQLCHLGNIALDLQQNLKIDPKNGRILNNKRAKKLWKRKYEKQWDVVNNKSI